MSAAFLYALVGAGLFALGLHALIVHAHLLRKILAINVMGSGVFLVLIGLAQRAGDAVPQAMVITGIVVAVSATALALKLMVRLAAETGHAEFPDDRSE